MKTSLEGFDCIIDVRSPAEYNHSHIPKAYNLPVLNDEEHIKVGTIYKQESPLKAKILGASLICKNIHHFLESLPQDKSLQDIFNHKNKILIYCARGGKRSEAMQAILTQIGFRVSRLQNGYKAYRNEVLNYFDNEMKYFFITLCGPTGCGKTEIIQSQEKWSVNLESLAKHYGSSFGHMASINGGQPSQKMFENLLYEELKSKSFEKILLIEAESQKLGKLIIPKTLFKAYHNEQIVLVDANLDSRIKRIVEMYHQISEEDFLSGMQKIKPYISKKLFDEIQALWNHKDLEKIAEILITKYYDKVYRIPKYQYKITHTDLKSSIEQILDIKEMLSKRLA